jgi:inner membrane protein
MVFIVEPVFWVAFGTPLAIMSTRPFARWLLFALLAGAPLCFALLGYLQWGSLLGLVVLGAVLAWLEHGWGPRDRRALLAGLAAGAGFVAVQAYAVQAARALVVAQAHQRDPASRVLDVPLSAFAANPLCWSFVAIESNEGAGSYRLSRGVLSLAPATSPVSSCPAALGGAPAETAIASAAGPAGLAWVWEETGQIMRLRALRSNNCQLDAWLRFARAPSLRDGLATDLRFGPPDRPNFSTLAFEEAGAQPCPRHVPGWDYPRADLLGLR